MKYLLLAFALFSFSPAIAGEHYIQLSSEYDQTGGRFVPEIIDAQSGILFSHGEITINKAGSYLIVFAPQTSKLAECGNYWLTLNNADLPNSNIQVCQTDKGQTTVAVAQAIVDLKRGDTIGFMQSGLLGTDATQPEGEPLIPSAIISIIRL